jgi:hypothetical protein
MVKSGSSSIGRAPAFQAGGCGFETRLPLEKLSPNPSVKSGFGATVKLEIHLPVQAGKEVTKAGGIWYRFQEFLKVPKSGTFGM